MIAHRRTLLALVATLAGTLPACLHVSGVPMAPPGTNVTATRTQPAPTEFGVLPSRPGEKIPTNPDAVVTSRRPLPTEPDDTIPPADLFPVKNEPAALPSLSPHAGPPEPPLLAAMRAYVENRPDRAIEHLKTLDRPNQDFVLAILPVLARGAAMSFVAADPNELAALAEQLHAAAARLEPRAALRIDTVAFTRKVYGFGRYDPWPLAENYKPNGLAELYVEVRHVHAEPGVGPNGEAYITRLSCSLEVKDSEGKLIDQADPADNRRRVPVARYTHTDFFRTPPHDYFRRYTLSVPRSPGVYTVTVEVRDPAGNRVARSQPVEFRVAGP